MRALVTVMMMVMMVRVCNSDDDDGDDDGDDGEGVGEGDHMYVEDPPNLFSRPSVLIQTPPPPLPSFPFPPHAGLQDMVTAHATDDDRGAGHRDGGSGKAWRGRTADGCEEEGEGEEEEGDGWEAGEAGALVNLPTSRSIQPSGRSGQVGMAGGVGWL